MTESTAPTLGGKIDDDRTKVNELLSRLGNVDKINEVIKVTRVGRINESNTRPRPTKIIFSNRNVVIQILKNKKKLLNSNIRINSDQTLMQREVFNKVKEELNRRISMGEQDIIIKFKNGIPKIEKNTYRKN